MQANPSRSSLSSIQRLSSFPESKNVLSWFFSDAKKTDFVLCGEEHGSAENWLVYRHLLETGIFGGFAYELFDSWQEGVRQFTYGQTASLPSSLLRQWKTMSAKGLVDGKVSKEFIEFFKWFRKYRAKNPSIHLILFDASSFPKGTFDWNVRDRIMSQNLLQERKLLTIKKPILVGTGLLHAKTEPFIQRNEHRYPLGYNLKRAKTLFIDFQYLGGFYFNIKKQSFPKRSQQSRPRFVLSKTKKKYIISIKQSHSIHPVL